MVISSPRAAASVEKQSVEPQGSCPASSEGRYKTLPNTSGNRPNHRTETDVYSWSHRALRGVMFMDDEILSSWRCNVLLGVLAFSFHMLHYIEFILYNVKSLLISKGRSTAAVLVCRRILTPSSSSPSQLGARGLRRLRGFRLASTELGGRNSTQLVTSGGVVDAVVSRHLRLLGDKSKWEVGLQVQIPTKLLPVSATSSCVET